MGVFWFGVCAFSFLGGLVWIGVCEMEYWGNIPESNSFFISCSHHRHIYLLPVILGSLPIIELTRLHRTHS